MIAAFVLLFTQSDSFAQYVSYNGKKPIVVAEDAVRHITVGGNVDLVIRQNTKPGTIVKIDGKDKERLKAGIAGSDLYLNSSDDERVVVYVWADDLETLTVKEKSFAVSIGILEFDNLRVNILDEGRVALRATDKIHFNAPQNRTFISGEKYYSVMSTDK